MRTDQSMRGIGQLDKGLVRQTTVVVTVFQKVSEVLICAFTIFPLKTQRVGTNNDCITLFPRSENVLELAKTIRSKIKMYLSVMIHACVYM